MTGVDMLGVIEEVALAEALLICKNGFRRRGKLVFMVRLLPQKTNSKTS